jgi:hypothetical protein
MDLGQHDVGLGIGEEAAALDRRQLGRVAQHQNRYAKRHQVAPELGIHHGAFIDHDQLGLGGRRFVPQLEGRGLRLPLDRPVDEAVDRGRPLAALAAHHQRGLAGESREQGLAVDVLGEMLGERGLAGARIAEQAEYRRRAGLAGPGLEPSRDRAQRGILLGRECGHRRAALRPPPLWRRPGNNRRANPARSGAPWCCFRRT